MRAEQRVDALIADLRARSFPAPVARVLRYGRRIFVPWLGEAMGRYPSVRRAFHPPRRNNFVHIFVPKSRDADAIIDGVHVDAAPLNDLDAELLATIREILSSRNDLVTPEALAGVKAWEHLHQGRSFWGAAAELEFVSAAVKEKSGLLLCDLVADKSPHIFEGLCQLRECSKILLSN